MDYAKYLTAASDKSNRINNLLSSLRRDEDDLEGQDLVGENKIDLNDDSQERIENLVNGYLNGSGGSELEEISNIYSTEAERRVNELEQETESVDSIEETTETEIVESSALKDFKAEQDLELSSDLGEKIDNGANSEELFEDKLLEMAGEDFSNAELVKEENINGETIKTFQTAEGKQISITTRNTDGNTYSTLKNDDGSTVTLRDENGGAGGVAVERRSTGYDVNQEADFTFVNADVIQQGKSSFKDVGNGEGAWVNEYSQIGVKDNSKIDEVVSTFYEDGTSQSEWEKDGVEFLAFGNGKVYESYSSEDDFMKANVSAVTLDENGKFKGYDNGENIDLNSDFYNNYEDKVSARREEMLETARAE